jgi:hypothetical protein
VVVRHFLTKSSLSPKAFLSYRYRPFGTHILGFLCLGPASCDKRPGLTGKVARLDHARQAESKLPANSLVKA